MANKLPINIPDLLRQRTVESERIEYKAGWNPDSIMRTVCAFANDFQHLGGGYIIIGQDCDDNGQPIFPPAGLEDTQLDKIQRELLAYCLLLQPSYSPLLCVEVIENRKLIVLWVPGGKNRPYKAPERITAKQKIYRHYIRRYASTIEAQGEDEQELLRLASRVPFDDSPNHQASLTDLSPALMSSFLEAIGSRLGEDVPMLSTEALGRQMNVVDGASEMPHPKNVGLMFFNETPVRFFPGAQIDVVWFPAGAGGGDLIEKTFKGPLDRMTREALDYIKRNYLHEMVTKLPQQAEALRVWNFPFAAVEEAVVNAVYHRSYEEREPVEVRISPDELTVLSFPGPDRSINASDLVAGKLVSRRYRNRRIGEFLKEMKLTEGRATGIPTILKVMAANGSPPPIFESDSERTSFVIRLPCRVMTPSVWDHSPNGTRNIHSFAAAVEPSPSDFDSSELRKAIADFRRQHVSGLIVVVFGLPGHGKTFLNKRIARGNTPVTVNILGGPTLGTLRGTFTGTTAQFPFDHDSWFLTIELPGEDFKGHVAGELLPDTYQIALNAMDAMILYMSAGSKWGALDGCEAPWTDSPHARTSPEAIYNKFFSYLVTEVEINQPGKIKPIFFAVSKADLAPNWAQIKFNDKHRHDNSIQALADISPHVLLQAALSYKDCYYAADYVCSHEGQVGTTESSHESYGVFAMFHVLWKLHHAAMAGEDPGILQDLDRIALATPTKMGITGRLERWLLALAMYGPASTKIHSSRHAKKRRALLAGTLFGALLALTILLTYQSAVKHAAEERATINARIQSIVNLPPGFALKVADVWRLPSDWFSTLRAQMRDDAESFGLQDDYLVGAPQRAGSLASALMLAHAEYRFSFKNPGALARYGDALALALKPRDGTTALDKETLSKIGVNRSRLARHLLAAALVSKTNEIEMRTELAQRLALIGAKLEREDFLDTGTEPENANSTTSISSKGFACLINLGILKGTGFFSPALDQSEAALNCSPAINQKANSPMGLFVGQRYRLLDTKTWTDKGDRSGIEFRNTLPAIKNAVADFEKKAGLTVEQKQSLANLKAIEDPGAWVLTQSNYFGVLLGALLSAGFALLSHKWLTLRAALRLRLSPYWKDVM